MINRSLIVLSLLSLLAILASGCSLLNPAPTLAPVPPVVTMAPAVPTIGTAVPTLGALDVVTATPGRTQVPDNTPTLPASPTPAPIVAAAATPRPRPTQTPAPSGVLFSTVKIYLVAINDNGKSGPRIGCDDSLIAVTRQIQPTNAPLTAALNELLSLHQRDYGQSGLITALYQSSLRIQNIAIAGGVATIRLTGQLRSGGVCDDPRIIGQLDYTARQFSTVRATVIFVNGISIQSLLSGRGP